MSYLFPLEPGALYRERRPQFINAGLPADDLDAVASRIRRMWVDEPGGWTVEFSALASRYASDGDMLRAEVAYGIAHFPVLASPSARQMMDRQRVAYLAAAKDFGMHLERFTLDVPYRGQTAAVPVHQLSRGSDVDRSPVLIASGGIDTWKMDLHLILRAFVRDCGVTVLAFDHPGTGETDVALDSDADEVVCGVVAAARSLGDGRVYHFGLSFGGNFATMTALRGRVDGAINVGGPVVEFFDDLGHLQFGMRDILSNVLGFTSSPTPRDLLQAASPFNRRELFDENDNPPMLVINGADDVHVPEHDTKIFEGRPKTAVHLIPATGHCAMSKLPEVIATMTNWLTDVTG